MHFSGLNMTNSFNISIYKSKQLSSFIYFCIWSTVVVVQHHGLFSLFSLLPHFDYLRLKRILGWKPRLKHILFLQYLSLFVLFAYGTSISIDIHIDIVLCRLSLGKHISITKMKNHRISFHYFKGCSTTESER